MTAARRFLIVSLGIAVALGVWTPPSAAQSSCILSGSGFFSPLPFAISCTYIGILGASDYACTWWGKCAPRNAVHETRSDCPNCQKPISLADGNTFIEQSDVQVPGLGGGLTLSRRWNSIWPATQTATQVGLFGPNWRSTYEERVFLGSDMYMKYARSDGSFWSFYTPGAGGTWNSVAPENVVATLVQGSSYWTLTFQNGEKRLFDINSGNLISIIDRNGNTTQVAYDATGRLTTVTDPASRHLYFSYANNTSFLVTSVTSDVGISLTYSYDTQGRLLQITKPDLTTLNFQYDSNSFISAVTDTSGKVLEAHTYDATGRGLTASRANGVEAVTLSYPKQ